MIPAFMTAKPPYYLVFAASFSGLAFEILLIRIFSTTLQYHYAFMIVGIAMLGLAAAGTLQSLFPSLRETAKCHRYAVLLGFALLVCYSVANRIPFDPVRCHWNSAHILWLGAYYLVLAVPFFLIGLIISALYHHHSQRSASIYAADLLGGAAGAAGILLALILLPPEGCVMALSLFLLLLTAISHAPMRMAAAAVITLLLAAILLLPAGMFSLRISPFKSLPTMLRYPGASTLATVRTPFHRLDTLRSPGIRYAPGLSLNHRRPLPPQIGLAVNGDAITAITRADDFSDLQFLEALPAALPYRLIQPSRALILEPRGGLGVLMARYHRCGTIVASDSIPGLPQLVEDRHGDFSGHIYRDSGIAVNGRHRLLTSGERFDLIEYSLLYSFPAAISGMDEQYLLTVEAFERYLKQLTPRGLLVVHLYLIPPPRAELRILTTVVAALKRRGHVDVARHIAAVRSWGTITILVCNQPFTAGDARMIQSFTDALMFDPVWYPGIDEGVTNRFVQIPGNVYHHAFRSILDDRKREGFIQNYLFNIVPATDNRPFFFHFLQYRHLAESAGESTPAWKYLLLEGDLLPFIFPQALLLGLVLLLLPLVKRNREKQSGGTAAVAGHIGYFSLLGMGFMLLEIALIQTCIRYVANPQLAVTIVLVTILAAAAAASLLSSRIRFFNRRAVCLVIAGIALPVGLLIHPSAAWMEILPAPFVLMILALLLFPPAFFMGLPFPAGLRHLGRSGQGLIPWAWAANGCFSVFSPIIGLFVARTAGFTAVFALAAACYAGAYFAGRGLFGDTGPSPRPAGPGAR